MQTAQEILQGVRADGSTVSGSPPVSRARFLIGFIVVLVPLAVLGSLAWAGSRDAGRLPDGAIVGGVAVGGLTRDQAISRLGRDLGRPAGREVTVHVGDRTFRLSADRAGVTLDIPAAVHRAHDAAHSGNFLQRGWRKITGERAHVEEPVHVTASAKAVRSFVGTIHSAVARKPVSAAIEMTVRKVSVTEPQAGRRLAGRDDLVRRITAALRTPTGQRDFRARVATVAPAVSGDDLWGATPLALTVSKEDKLVRVFDRGELVKSYHVAVGMAEYPTPDGRFAIQSVEKNPVWTVPNSDWAGDLAGKVIPGGDPQNPLKAYFVRFNGAVGFHGTADLGSLGSAASHGCVRMNPKDVTDLAGRVTVGTPVLVGA
jgi:lipoprotein-anchoring transpeptidase ErfK/SrfK